MTTASCASRPAGRSTATFPMPSCWKSWRRARKCSSPATCAARTSISRRRFWRRTRISSSAKRRTLMPACTSRFSRLRRKENFLQPLRHPVRAQRRRAHSGACQNAGHAGRHCIRRHGGRDLSRLPSLDARRSMTGVRCGRQQTADKRNGEFEKEADGLGAFSAGIFRRADGAR